MKAIVLLSGGLDSSTMLAMAIKRDGLHPRDITALSLYYGQKHEVELIQAQKVASYYEVRTLQKELDSGTFKSDESSLTGNREMPHETYQELMAGEGPSPTYVPFRNGNLLSAATSLGLTLQASLVYFGAHSEDAHNWAYPDCTPEFIGAMANAIYVGSYFKVRLVTPLEWMMKKDIVKVGLDLNVPYDITHSCYEGRRPACGKCPTCVERLAAFEANGVRDPLEYEVADASHR